MDSENKLPNSHARTIIHIDIDCFYAQVEMVKNENLRNVALGIQQKNIVVTSNYIARQQGVMKCMLVTEALKVCPNLVLVNGEDLHDYRQISYKVTSHLQKYSTQVERLGLDENFVDITDLVASKLKAISASVSPVGHVFGNTEEACDCGCNLRLTIGSMIAQEVRESIMSQFQLTCSAGISHNKLLSKLVGSKHKPNQQTIAFPNSACELLYSLNSIGDIPGIGRVMFDVLTNMSIASVKDLQNCEHDKLKSALGEEKALFVKNLSNGIDNSVVKTSGKPQSIGLEDSCKNITAIGEVKDKLNHLLSRLMVLVSEDGRIPHTIKLTIRKFDNATKMSNRESRQTNITSSLFSVTNNGIELLPKSKQRLMSTIMALFNKLIDVRKPYHITLLGLSYTKFLERMNGKSSITSFFRKNVEVQSITNIENKDEICTSPMDCSAYSNDFKSDGSESEFEPSPKKTKFTRLIAKRRYFESDDCPSPSKLKVADLHLSSKHSSSEDSSDSRNSFSDDNSNICCPPDVDVSVFKELPKELQQELWHDYKKQMNEKQQMFHQIKKPKVNTLLNYFLKN